MSGIVERVIVPIGGTDREYEAQEYAIQMAEALGAPAYAVHVHGEPGQDHGEVFRYISELADRHGVELSTRTLEGDPAKEIIAEATPRDLIVIGTRRIQDRYRFGSVALEIAQGAEAPVQMVRLGA